MTTPSALLPLPVDQWDIDLAHVSADMKGAPLNVHKLMANNPGLLRAWWNFRNHSVAGGALGPILGELVILRVAVHLGAWYEWGSHVDRAVRLGMPLARVNAVLDRRVGPDWPPQQALVLAAVDDLMTHRAIRSATLCAAEQVLTHSQILDLIAIQGMYVILGGMIQTWGLALDEEVGARIKPLADQDGFEAAARRFAAPDEGGAV